MSPQVSQPRRRLPTMSRVAPGAASRSHATSGSARVAASAEQVTAGMRLALGDRLQDERFLLRAHALEAAERAGLGRRFEVVERGDAQRFVEQRHRLRPDTLQAQQVEDRRRELLEQLVAIGGRAGGGDVADARGEVLADAGDRQRSGRRSGRRAAGRVGDDLRGGAVGPDPERVLALQLEQVGDLVEQAGDVGFSTGSDMRRSARCARALSRARASRRSHTSRYSPRRMSMPTRHPRPHRRTAHQRLRRADAAARDARARARVRPRRHHHVLAQRRSAGAGRRARASPRESLRKETPLWVSVDQEGGRVAAAARSRSRGGRRWRRWAGREGRRAGGAVREGDGAGAAGRRHHARLRARARHPDQRQESGHRRSRVLRARRGRRDAGPDA